MFIIVFNISISYDSMDVIYTSITSSFSSGVGNIFDDIPWPKHKPIILSHQI